MSKGKGTGSVTLLEVQQDMANHSFMHVCVSKCFVTFDSNSTAIQTFGFLDT
jgi:hypothetical protein